MVEKSAGAIIFRKERGKIFYLLLHYPSFSHRAGKDYWDLPKGHIEKGEKPEYAAKREVEEETGLKNIDFFEGFRETIKYFFKWENKNILKFVTFYLAETKAEKIKISSEHLGSEWLLYEKALKRLSHKNAREVIEKANEFLVKYATFS